MCINITKTKELVFHRPHASNLICLVHLIVSSKNMLLNFLEFSLVINLALRIMWILCWLCVLNVYTCRNCWKAKAYHPSSCRQYLLPRYSHALHAIWVWGGHLTSQQRQRINAFLKRAQKFGFTESIYCIEVEKSDTKLFGRLTNPAHCLYPILPGNNKFYEFLLRKRGHTFTLPHYRPT